MSPPADRRWSRTEGGKRFNLEFDSQEGVGGEMEWKEFSVNMWNVKEGFT